MVTDNYWLNSLVDLFVHPPLWLEVTAPGKCGTTTKPNFPLLGFSDPVLFLPLVPLRSP